MKRPDMKAVHWHLIPGGIEFEDADGEFIHITLDQELYLTLGERMSAVRIAPQSTPGAPIPATLVAPSREG